MSTPADRSWPRRVQHSRWAGPVFAVALGLVMLSLQAARGDVGGGVGSLVIMVAYAAVLVLLGGRLEVVTLLRGNGGDERANQLQTRAMAFTGAVLVNVLVVGFLVELARGAADLGVWTGLCALAGLTWIVSLAVLSRRS